MKKYEIGEITQNGKKTYITRRGMKEKGPMTFEKWIEKLKAIKFITSDDFKIDGLEA